MPENRFFLETPFKKHQEYTLDVNESHHVKVLRKKKNDKIEVINGQNQLAIATIISEGKNVHFVIEEIQTKPPKKNTITLAQCITEHSKLDLILTKTTELGVDKIILFPSDSSKKRSFNDQQLQKAKNHLISAIKQCARLDLPTLDFQTLEKIHLEKHNFFGNPQSKIRLPKFQESVLFFNGPPHGFSIKEISYLKKNATGILLNHNILRSETAAICATALLSNNFDSFLMS